MTRRPKCSDLPDADVSQACAEFHDRLDDRAPLDILAALHPHLPEKLIRVKMERLYRRGLIDCGVSLRTAWPTGAGRNLIADRYQGWPIPRAQLLANRARAAAWAVANFMDERAREAMWGGTDLTPDVEFFSSDALVELRDSAIDAHREGRTVEFHELGD